MNLYISRAENEILKHNSYLSVNFITRGVWKRPSSSSLFLSFSWLLATVLMQFLTISQMFYCRDSHHPLCPALYNTPPPQQISICMPRPSVTPWSPLFPVVQTNTAMGQKEQNIYPFPITICKQPWHMCVHPSDPFPTAATQIRDLRFCMCYWRIFFHDWNDWNINSQRWLLISEEFRTCECR